MKLIEQQIRTHIRQKIKAILESRLGEGSSTYTLVKSDKGKFLASKNTKHYNFKVLKNKKTLVGEYTVDIPEKDTPGDAVITFSTKSLIFSNKERGQLVEQVAADLVEFIEQDINKNKSIIKIVVKGLMLEVEKDTFYEQLELSFNNIRRSSSGRDLIVFLDSDDVVPSGIKGTDVMGRDTLKFKGQPSKNLPRKQVKPATIKRKRKPKSNNDE